MKLLEWFHESYVHTRRVQALAQHLCELLPRNAVVLDVGCGDGHLASTIMRKRPDVCIMGIDVLVRGKTEIRVAQFDGKNIPCGDGSVDAVMFIDVLHHTLDPATLLREAARVSSRHVLIKDHLADGPFAVPLLRLMDHVGNARHGVALPYNYWPEQKWKEVFHQLEWRVTSWDTCLHLYPVGLDHIFGGSLHFIASVTLNCWAKNVSPGDRVH